MTNEALPNAAPAAPVSGQQTTAQVDLAENIQSGAVEGEEGQQAAEIAKPEKTPEERERARMQRGIDRKTRQAAEARAEAAHLRAEIQRLTAGSNPIDNRTSADDSEPVSLTKAQLAEYVKAEAEKLAPTLRSQAAEVERRKGVVDSLAKTWGTERFDELAADLNTAFDGLADTTGTPKPSVEAIFEADDPAKVIEYLADPEHDDEAEAISRMTAAQAGKAIAKLESKLSTMKADAAPQPSKAPAPLEPVRGAGPAKKALADLSGKDFDKRRREQIANRH